jgi:glycerophosphoryl diester phosphodiesterase
MRRSLAIIGLAAVGITGCKKGAEPSAEAGEAAELERRVELQGHRGARGLAPENTIPGVRTALEIGVDTIELDVRLTADDQLVVHHDAWLNPSFTRDREGAWVEPQTHAVRQLSLAAIQRFDVSRVRAATEHADRFPRARATAEPVAIPSLPEVIRFVEGVAGGAVGYNIETKISPDQRDTTPEELADAVIATIRAAGIESRATIQSFDWRTLARVRERAPAIATACLTSRAINNDTVGANRPGPSPWTAGLDVDDHGGSTPRLVAAAGCRIWSPDAATLRRPEVALAHELGLRVIVWTVNEPADIARALDLGVDGVITDYPDRAREVMASRGLPLPPPRPAPD